MEVVRRGEWCGVTSTRSVPVFKEGLLVLDSRVFDIGLYSMQNHFSFLFFLGVAVIFYKVMKTSY